MNPETRVDQGRADAKESRDRGSWFATFSFLDAGCAISSSQLQGLVASITKLWQRTIGRLA
jgi:hypothetical protein